MSECVGCNTEEGGRVYKTCPVHGPGLHPDTMGSISSEAYRTQVLGIFPEEGRISEEIPGGVKADGGKARFDLLSPVLLWGVARVLEFGARKYADRNWEKGIKYGRVFSALMRHLWAWWGGEDKDPETGESHLYHAGCCLMFLTHFEEDPATYSRFDDRPGRAT